MEYSANMFNYENFPQQGGQTVHCEGVNLLFFDVSLFQDLLTLDQANKHAVIFYNEQIMYELFWNLSQPAIWSRILTFSGPLRVLVINPFYKTALGWQT